MIGTVISDQVLLRRMDLSQIQLTTFTAPSDNIVLSQGPSFFNSIDTIGKLNALERIACVTGCTCLIHRRHVFKIETVSSYSSLYQLCRYTVDVNAYK